MAEIKTFKASGEATKSLDIPESIAGANAGMGLIHQVAIAELAGRRQGNACALTRGEVRGSNVKIRRQKGTGRSRQGDKRTPHMRGGGVVHGPRPRSFAQATPRKMRQSAFRTVLNSRAQNDRIYVLESELAIAKTKAFATLLSSLNVSKQKVLFLSGAGDQNYALAARNLPLVTSQTVGQTNVTDILGNDVVLCTHGAWAELNARAEGKLNLQQVEGGSE